MVEWRSTLEPGESRPFFVTVACDASAGTDCRFLPNLRRAHRARVRASRRQASASTSNAIFNELLCRSMADRVMLTTDTPPGPYPYAGIPWFSTAFRRDGIITGISGRVFSPGAWASAAPFGLLAAALGLELDERREKITFRHPRLPACIDEVELRNLRPGSSALDVLLRRRGKGVAVTVLGKSGPATVAVLL